jgi:hypothetical protein
VNSSLTQSVLISVVDENEAPNFGPSSGFTIDENLSNNTVIGRVNAADVDAVDQLTYSLSSSVPVSAFSIDAVTGEILVRDSSLLNYEAHRTITLTVQVTDHAGLTDFLTTVVTLRDINEVPTAINLTGGMVTENSTAGVLVATVTGTDADAGDQLAYTLTNDASGRFAVDTRTGVITVTAGANLNFEVAASHNITVRATDSFGLSFDQSFTINVLNINEAPIAYADHYFTFQLTTLDLPSLLGVLANDYDDDGDVLTAQLISAPWHGILLFRPDGSLRYDPVDVFTGTVTITYRVTDGITFSNPATIVIDVLTTVNPGGDNGDGSGDDNNTGGNHDVATSTTPGNVIVPPGLGGGTINETNTTETTIVKNTVVENSGGGVEAAIASVMQIAAINVAVTETRVAIVDSGFTDRVVIDDRPENSTQSTTVRYGSSSWRSSADFVLPFDALVRSVELQVSPDIVSHTKVEERIAGFTTGDLVVGTSAVVSTSVSVGIMIWVLRGGSLLTAFMSATPVWTAFDPLPILVNRHSEEPKDDDTLLSLVKGLKK